MRDIDRKKQDLLDMHWIINPNMIEGDSITLEFKRYAGKAFITKIAQIGFNGISEKFFNNLLQDILDRKSSYLKLANFKRTSAQAQENKAEYIRNLCKSEVQS